MCTLTWLTTERGFELCFNRDEARGRSRAFPPKIYHVDGTRVLMPIDPDGMGTWIAANEHGLVVCLLNDYQHGHRVVPTRSRGQLVKSVSVAQRLSHVANIMMAQDMRDFSPFMLVAFAPDSASGSPVFPLAWRWNGRVLKEVNCLPPVVSSAVDIEAVAQARSDYLALQLRDASPVGTLLDYHRSHVPNQGHLSVCMHRDDASTVSLTHICVDTESVDMHYYDGSPCRVSTPQAAQLPLTADVASYLKTNTSTDTH
ncbi:NRDE family protein [Salinivibrio sp. ES.052]|uniref:NRDE family protein n=1 Tax=Salinivibrio sp. ES.052 TaxID=1882823 RepID=UPI00092A610B|nr:NRDE family protein [Salinivibrio sp. ES.052]SIO35409.1 Transport and Golgi organisation 2 [Salinivibrio sp. ES.052]